MRFPIPSALTAIAVCFLTGSPAIAQDAEFPTAEDLASLGLEKRWSNQAVLDVSRDVVIHVSNDENLIYVVSSGGVLTTFDAENGKKLWAAQTGVADEPSTPAVSNKDLVMLISGPVVHAFQKFTGEKLIEFRIKGSPSAPPVMGDGVFYVAIGNGALYAYSTNVLEHEYRYGELPDNVALPHLWRYICGEEVRFAPVLGDEAVAVVTDAGNLHSVNTTGLHKGRTRFQVVLNRPASGPPGIAVNQSSSSVLTVTGDNQVYSFDLLRGVMEWTYPMGRNMTKMPLIVGDQAYVASSDGSLTQFNRNTSSLNYGRPTEIPQYSAPNLIGAGIEDVQIDQSIQDALGGKPGVRIANVVPGGPAALAGLRSGDILRSVETVNIPSVDVAQEVMQTLPLRVARSIEVIRVDAGMHLHDVILSDPDGKNAAPAVVIGKVQRDTVAFVGGIQEGDLLTHVGDAAVTSVDDANRLIAAAAPGAVTVKVRREGEELSVDLPLNATDVNGPIRNKDLKLRIPIQKWDVGGMQSVCAVGRFSVFGIDQARRLVAFDRKDSTVRGRAPVLGYKVHLNNYKTDQVYLVSESGEVVCLREIGPTVRMPDLSALSQKAKVTKISVKVDDPVDVAGTVLCEVELADGSTEEISASVKGVIRTIHVREGQEVSVGDPLFQIFDDQFATYHQKPQDQPVDVELQDDNAVNDMPADPDGFNN